MRGGVVILKMLVYLLIDAREIIEVIDGHRITTFIAGCDNVTAVISLPESSAVHQDGVINSASEVNWCGPLLVRHNNLLLKLTRQTIFVHD